MDALRLVHRQLAIERIGLDADGCLIRLPGPDPDEIARVAAYRHPGGYLVYFRADVPSSTRERIRALGAERAFHDHDAVTALLAADAACCGVDTFHTYTFPDDLSPHQFPDVVRLGEAHRELAEAYHPGMALAERAVFAVIRDDQIVSTCTSAREDAHAGEGSVFTVPAYRRRGYGRQVTAAWGHDLLTRGKVALYSHVTDNVASQAVARSLGLSLRFSLTVYS
jgi:RimJ/RimL family protein N-acetyltransferase